MDYKKGLLAFCLIMCILFCISCVAAGDVNDTAIASEVQSKDLIELENQEVLEASPTGEVSSVSPQSDEVLNVSANADDLKLSNQSDEVLGFSTSRLYISFTEEPYLIINDNNDIWIFNENMVQFPKQSAVKIVAKDLGTGKTYADIVPIESIEYEYGMENIHYMVCADMFKKIPWTAKHKYLVRAYWVSPHGQSTYLGKKTLQVKVMTNEMRVYARNINTHIYSGEKYGVTVYKANGQLAKNVEVLFFINNKMVAKAKTNSNGLVYFKIPQKRGIYKVNADVPSILSGTPPYKLKVTHCIDLPKVAVKKSANKLTIKATLKKIKGKILKGQNIVLNFNGKKYVAKTNKNGVAVFTIGKSVLKTLKVGKAIKYSATYLKDTTTKAVKVQK